MPHEWVCNGLHRNEAHLVSTVNGSAAFGGTPDDQSVVAAIKDLKARGLQVCFTPFILMDIPDGNTLPDPYSGGTGQAVYPWRGRITKDYSTADKTPQAGAEVASFVAQYRNFVLHYADLCALAGGVDVFLLGTELRGLTWMRDAEGSYPFVSALVQLAADVKAILPNAQLSYAADWSEWFGHQPADGSGDVFFHLDPLWSDANIAAVAFDNYWPLSDWRDTAPNIDEVVNSDGTLTAITDYDYLMGNVRGGEGYAWYYASQADRVSQTRTPITDGAYGKPWVFRYKDVWSWWSNQHFNRPGGIENPSPTAWVPQSKPFWFTELGCPSIDKGSNEPNVFYDPEIVGKRNPVLLGWHFGLSHSAALSQLHAALFQLKRSRVYRGPQSAKPALCGAHGRSQPHDDLHLGCKALSLFSALRFCLERRPQLDLRSMDRRQAFNLRSAAGA